MMYRREESLVTLLELALDTEQDVVIRKLQPEASDPSVPCISWASYVVNIGHSKGESSSLHFGLEEALENALRERLVED